MEGNNNLTRANKLFQDKKYDTHNRECIIVCYELKNVSHTCAVALYIWRSKIK